MEPVIHVNQGECVHEQFSWFDAGGPINLTGREVSIVDAYPRALMAGTFTVVDAVNGKANLYIPAAVAASMGKGRVNWIRVGHSLPNGCPDTTPRTWIEVV